MENGEWEYAKELKETDGYLRGKEDFQNDVFSNPFEKDTLQYHCYQVAQVNELDKILKTQKGEKL